ncbi:MAG: insulinase family protein [Gemmatimonadales bacterium]
MVPSAKGSVCSVLVAAFLVPGLLTLPGVARAQYPTTPPAPTALRPVRFPAFVTARLPNGMDLIVVERHKQPVVTVSLAVPGGNIYEPADKTGLADIVAELLTKGTATRTADQMAAEVEGAGGSVFAGADPDFLRIGVSSLSERLPLALDVLADIVTHSTFPASEVELARTRALSSLQLELSQPASIADRIFRHEVYGSHPYGRSTTPASLRAVTRDDIVAFYGQRVRPGGALLVVAGDVNAASVRQLATRTFAAWRGAAAPEAAQPAIPARTRTELILVNKPGAVQSNILAGFPFITPRDPAVYPLTIANKILGGGTDARLFLILREQHGWTYGSYSGFSRLRGTGSFEANAEVRTAVTDSALAELLHQMDRIRNEVPPDSEIAAAKNYLAGSFPLTIQTAQQIAGAVANARLLGLPADYVSRYRERLAAVSTPELTAAARSHFATDRMVILVVGDGPVILPKLKPLGYPIRIVDVEGNPLTEADLSPRASAVNWVPDHITPMNLTYRVLFQGNPMGDASRTVARTTLGGRAVVQILGSTNIGAMVRQSDTTVIDAQTLAPVSMHLSTAAQGQQMFVRLDYDGTHVRGQAHMPGREGMHDVNVDTTLAAGTLDENEMEAVLGALPLAANARFTLPVFAGSEGHGRVLTLAVGGEESVTVPAGTFACWRVEMTGGDQGMTLYVSREAPFLIVKYAMVGIPMAFELTARQ